ncbi:acetyl-CoA carboxylase, biotin carboxyl carrier protein [Hoeflea phototrophica DFL-43]|jgi:acetyl-CoA carboxylase biotin carboxyl carrier protein|uniref:Biotin carboxyl carrier protein of acetyl-CoA carboxylase n=1 Tax=Hoeflea phototrophica (strain DSM 17068 / NCIMB 14078 / DFL-43) TaxID=411684 RepID=A9D579_HOEPD|nr:acetyl-CoA carboxylase biotin carboxyl carrier protein [Hoeflea phototrophica]EDQ34054.1 acetyl-CoA carboxylase, biotin carboxyl carrier protein [Hoeflea phototrophica DFL-43]
MATRKPSIDQDLIRDLANILNETDLTEIEIEQDDLRVRVSRAGTPQTIHAPIAQAPAPQAAAPAPVAAAPAEAAPAAPSVNAVTAPMVGTVYLAPAPDAKPFVEVGQTVKEGQTILIIEAMKTMNQIPSPRSGKVTSVLVGDGHPVEFAEPMIVIE